MAYKVIRDKKPRVLDISGALITVVIPSAADIDQCMSEATTFGKKGVTGEMQQGLYIRKVVGLAIAHVEGFEDFDSGEALVYIPHQSDPGDFLDVEDQARIFNAVTNPRRWMKQLEHNPSAVDADPTAGVPAGEAAAAEKKGSGDGDSPA